MPLITNGILSDEYDQFRGINANMGLLWETRGAGRFGVVIKTAFTASMAHRYRSSSTIAFGLPVDTIDTNTIEASETVELQMPLVYGAGWSKRFSDQWTLGVDISRTHWDQYILTDEDGNDFSPIDGRPKSQSKVDPTIHVRLGTEYVFLLNDRLSAVPIRAGLFYDPEPGRDGSLDFYGVALGGGLTKSRFSLDIAYQLRWGLERDADNLIAESKADKIRHTALASIIYYL